jgi:hypothetical protein
MEKKLRKKFIYFSVGIIFFVLLSVSSFINISNLFTIRERSDILLNILAENDGEFSKTIDKSDIEILKNRLTPKITLSNRFFAVKTDIEQNVITVNTVDLYLTSSKDAVEYAKKALKTGKTTGYIDRFKYKIKKTDYGLLIVFIDLSSDFDNFYYTLKNSFLISFVVLILVFVISFLLSKKVVSPMVKAYEKQKSFITDASHELKTPLAIINTNTDVIEMENGESKWTLSIHKQVERLNELVKNLISLAKLEEEEIQKTNFSLSDIIYEISNDYEEVCKNINRELKLNIEKNIQINADEKLIRKLITILIENAVKYSKENTQIKLNLEKQNKKIIFTIENEADNLKIKKYDELFERFYRADFSRNRKTGGYGIGLSIAQSIAIKHKTKIQAESLDGKTIKFSIKF